MPGDIAFIAAECIVAAIMIFGDIGFDHPGRYGFDIVDGIRFAILLAHILANGIIYAACRRQWRQIAAQVGNLAAINFVVNILPYSGGPLDAADYQHLKGKTSQQVRVEMWPRARLGSGVSGGRQFEAYKGIMIYYSGDDVVFSDDDIVTSVENSGRR